ncbi:hypothetical protein BS47DRAFT_1369952, partial [Hydnum rufescens UP504]
LWLDVYPQVIAVHREQQKLRFSVQLLFKTRQICDELKTLVSSWATLRGVDIGTPPWKNQVGHQSAFTGWKDLEYVDQVYAHARNLDELNALLQGAPPCIKGGAERAHYGEFFLPYDTFPPLSGAAHQKQEAVPSGTVLSSALSGSSHALPGYGTMLIFLFIYRSLGAGFAVPMWPTEGPVDAVIRCISRMAQDDMGSILTLNPVADESFWLHEIFLHLAYQIGLGPQLPSVSKV